MEGKSGRFSLILVNCDRFRWILVHYDWFSLILIDFQLFLLIFVDFGVPNGRQGWIFGDFGRLWRCLGGSWGSSAFRNLLSGQVFEEGAWKRASKETTRSPKKRQKRPKKAPKASKMSPKRVQNRGLKVLKTMLGRNIRKTSKSTSLSSENRDFGGTEGRKLTQNWSKIRCRTLVNSIET